MKGEHYGQREIIQMMTVDEVENNKGKFFLNENRNTLHIIGNCCHTKALEKRAKIFSTEDEAIASETRYMSYCKLCFKKL